ncbi:MULTISPECIES: hypothetical protein [unclassified Akkermansia]|nr:MULTISPECIES: hypothetical protein [unclassified Akkermansia]
MGRSPETGTWNSTSDPGLTPRTRAPLIDGSGDVSGVRRAPETGAG